MYYCTKCASPVYSSYSTMWCPHCGGHGSTKSLALPTGEVTPEPPARVQGKILGFRTWIVSGLQLKSLTRNEVWKIGEPTTARCLLGDPFGGFTGSPHGNDPAPNSDCFCGLYAYHSLDSISPSGFIYHHTTGGQSVVYGAVLAWGNIQVHCAGFRAQYAQPVVLAYKGNQSYDEVVQLMTLASEMDIPLCEVDELKAKADSYGKPVDSSLRPAKFESPSYSNFYFPRSSSPLYPLMPGGYGVPAYKASVAASNAIANAYGNQIAAFTAESQKKRKRWWRRRKEKDGD